MKRRTALKAYARVLEWLSVVVGLLLVGSCTTVGFKSGGIGLGLLNLAATVGLAVLLVGAVFLLTTMSADVMDLRSRVDAEPKEER
jgi:hypothetical protein